MIKNFLVVVLVNYNGFSDTEACLKSIKSVEAYLPFVVIVDNASKNAMQLDNLQVVYPNLKIIYNHENVGFGRANNIGIKWVQENLDFEYLLLLNNDTIVEKHAFQYLVDAFKINPDIGITTSKIMYNYDRNLVWYGGGDINYKRGWPKIADYNQAATDEGANKSRYVSFVSGCVMMFTKKCIKNLIGFDDDFFMYSEDFELCLRANRMNYKMYYEPCSIVYHKVQGSSKRQEREVEMVAGNPNLDFLFYNMMTNVWIAAKKNYSLFHFIIFNFTYWSRFIFRLIRLAFNGHITILVTGLKVIHKIMIYSINKHV